MKIVLCSLILSVSFVLLVRADLTIVYASTVRPASQTSKDQAAEAAGAGTNITIKIKGDRARIDASPQVTTIFDGKTGEVITLLNDQKTIVRISSDKMKAVTDMLDAANTRMPDFRDFPGLPIRNRMIIGKEGQEDKPGPRAADHATEITSTVTSVNQNPISDSEFTVPSDFKLNLKPSRRASRRSLISILRCAS